jgi:hypothetical protein
MNLEKIVWPVFRLSEKEPQIDNGVIYYATEYTDLDTSESTGTLRIVDDRNIPKPTLSRRRLAMLVEDVKLFPIRQAIYFLGDLLKQAKSTTWFIDSAGTLFQYSKTRRARVIVRRITKVLPTEGLGSIIELEGIAHRFKTVFKPDADTEYAAVLQYGLTYIFYGLYKDKPNESWRMI